ncbi:hypothetical protein C8R43DRAFT_1157237 [Mycena crocata]|nr:hypothetical protein C8R43DRAFT_1157237 [Mycena crocata]
MSSIPLDLLGDIVDQLQHDRASLKACSLVASSFSFPSQRHLFGTTWLKCHDLNPRKISSTPPYSDKKRTPTSTIQKISVLFAKSPHLGGTYVRHLTAELFFSFKLTDGETQLHSVLRATSNLETFALAGGPIRWRSLSRPLASTILDVIAQPSLFRLHLWSMQGVPAAIIFGALSSMTVLSISNTTIQPEDANSAVKKSSRLKQLMLSNTDASVHALILSPWAPTLSNVTRLLISVGRGRDFGGTERLFALSATLMRLMDAQEKTSLTSFIPEGFATAPGLFATTLASLPHAALTLVFSNGRFPLEKPRLERTPIPGLGADVTGLGGKSIDAKTVIRYQFHRSTGQSGF